MPRSFLVKKTEKVRHVTLHAEPKKLSSDFVKKEEEKPEVIPDNVAAPEKKEEVTQEPAEHPVSPVPLSLTSTPHPEDLPALPPTWMVPYHHHSGISPFEVSSRMSREELLANKFRLNDERTMSPFLPYPPALHPLAVRLENSYFHDFMSNARASLYSSLNHPVLTEIPPASPSPQLRSETDDDVYDKSSIFGLDLRTSKVASTPPSPPPSDSSSISPGRESVSSKSTSYKNNNFQAGVTVAYTYDAFFVTDGRSRKKNQLGLPEKTSLRYTCNECGKNYATSSNLSRHKQTHRSLDSQQAKQCPHCDKKYVSMPALSMHILTHELKHKCPVCNKSFSRPWLLQGHMRSHTGEKPYGCAHCGKAFADRSNLRAHMQTHSVYKSFECQRCHKSFALKSYLNKHYESACFKDGLECKPMYCDQAI